MEAKYKLWALYGISETLVHGEKIGSPFDLLEQRDLVAFFSGERKAKDYVRKARLKTPRPRRGFQEAKVFRKDSLLGGYSYVEIEPYCAPDVPVDP
jgi:hypothetical protein